MNSVTREERLARMRARGGPRRMNLKTITSFTDLEHAVIFVNFESCMLNGGAEHKLFHFHVRGVSVFGAGKVASGYVVVDNVKVPTTVRLCELTTKRRYKGKPPIGMVQIGERGDTGGLLCPWIGEWFLVGVQADMREDEA